MALKQGMDTAEALWDWVLWARRSRLEPFVKLQRAIVKHWDAITAAAEHSLSNGLIESMNTKIRLITRMAFGFKDASPLIALAMLSLGGHRPTYQAVKPHNPTHGSDRGADFLYEVQGGPRPLEVARRRRPNQGQTGPEVFTGVGGQRAAAS